MSPFTRPSARPARPLGARLPLVLGRLLMMGVAVALTPAALAQAQAQTQGGGQAPRATQVVVDPVLEEALSETSPVLGRIVTNQGGTIASAAAGPVERVLVVVGDRVNAGDTLVVLDTEDIRLEREQALAEMRVAEAQLAVARAELAKGEQTLDRLVRLRDSAAFSQARYEDQVQDVARLQADIRVAEQVIAQRRAAVERFDAELDRAVTRAPYDGVVTTREVSAGAYVSPGTALLTLLSVASAEVEADIPADRIAALEPGARVYVRLAAAAAGSVAAPDAAAAAGGASAEGVVPAAVRAIVPVENPLTRTRAVRFRLLEAADGLAIGQAATVEVPVSAARQGLTVHKDALVQTTGGTLVYVVAEGVAEPRPVQLGKAIGNRFEVLGGLTVGEPVVIRGNERLRPGEAVEARQAAAATGAGGGDPAEAAPTALAQDGGEGGAATLGDTSPAPEGLDNAAAQATSAQASTVDGGGGAPTPPPSPRLR